MKTIHSPHSFLFLHINAVLNMSTLFPIIVIVYLSPHKHYCKLLFRETMGAQDPYIGYVHLKSTLKHHPHYASKMESN